MEQHIRDARIYVQRRVGEGFEEPWEIVEGLLELHQEFAHASGERDPRSYAYALVDEYLEAHYREQATWNGLTDCDKLDSAFAELNSYGIIARQHFTWSQRQGHTEIIDEIDDVRFLYGLDPVGYVFYHMQDTESAYLYGSLYLAFGSVDDDELATILVAHRIIEALESAGLEVEWDGTLKSRIKLINLDWKRRRTILR